MKKLFTALVVGLLFVLVNPQSASAYTGYFTVLPPIAGGPGSTTVTQYWVDTETSNPQYIYTGLTYVESITITTHSGQTGPLLIKENPYSSDPVFSITVPKKINDDLISATIQFWGPDVESLEIWHDHNGEDPVLVSATKVSPLQYDENGNVLWTVTTDSFSDFYINPEDNSLIQNKQFPLIPVALLSIFSIVPVILFRQSYQVVE